MKRTYHIKTSCLATSMIVALLIIQSCSGPEKKSEDTVKADSITAKPTATTVKTSYVDSDGRKLAYRVVGTGNPVILCNRFRGTLDDWDPAFIDELAKRNQVIIFDYAGIGKSTFRAGIDTLKELLDIRDLADHLGIQKFDLAGWSHGGKVAQVFAAQNTERIKHLILLGTGPIGKTSHPVEKIFLERALKPVNDFEDEIILFFEPKYQASRDAAKASHDRVASRQEDRDVYVTPDKFEKYFQSVTVYNSDEAGRKKLFESTIPMLAISGEHDIVFPIENWYEQTRLNPNLQIIMRPQAGQGPQSQYPELAAKYIQAFIEN